uniref:Uncharacterized protein n=1 Tax=Entomoneis paludosa TaxID=265537 RepID=A0A7S2YKP7_9STRA
MHVTEPSGRTVNYNNKRGRGSILSKDFTQGYGPEVYILKASAVQSSVAKYEAFAHYYASHQDSKLTGATSAVVWTIQKTPEKKQVINFSFARLNTNKERTQIASVDLERTL